MSNKPKTVILYESFASSIISDVFTFAVTAGLVLLADGRSVAWQILTISMFVFWVAAKPLAGSKIHKFYSKRELSQWVDSLPDDKDGGAA